VSVAGKILIAKQMQLHADEQVLHAQEVEALGLLLFPDITRNDWRGEESASNIPRDAVRRDSLLWNGMVRRHTFHPSQVVIRRDTFEYLNDSVMMFNRSFSCSSRVTLKHHTIRQLTMLIECRCMRSKCYLKSPSNQLVSMLHTRF